MKSIFKIPNIRNALFIVAAKNGWFVSSTWIYFWLLFFNYTEIGIIDAVIVLIAFFLEIPFGALADLVGRRKVLIGAYLAMTIGPLLMATAQSTLPIIVGNFLFYVGYSAQSGAFDAIVYDTLKEIKRESEYPKYYSKSLTLGWIINGLSLIIGGITAGIDQRIPFFLWGLFYFLGLIFTLFLKEPLTDKKQKVIFADYIKQNIDGIKKLFSPHLREFIIFILFTLGFIYFYDWSFLRPAIGKENGLDAFWQSLVYALSSIPAALIVLLIPFFKKHISNKLGAIILSLLLSGCYILFSTPLGIWISIPMILLSMLSSLAYSWMTIIINSNVDTAHRATAVSGMYTLSKIPYILLAIVAGQIIDNGNLYQLNMGIAIAVGISSFILLVSKRV